MLTWQILLRNWVSSLFFFILCNNRFFQLLKNKRSNLKNYNSYSIHQKSVKINFLYLPILVSSMLVGSKIERHNLNFH